MAYVRRLFFSGTAEPPGKRSSQRECRGTEAQTARSDYCSPFVTLGKEDTHKLGHKSLF